MYSTFNPDTYEPTGGSLVKGMYSALSRKEIGIIHITNAGASWLLDATIKIKDIVENHADKVEGVVSISLSPRELEGESTVRTWEINEILNF